MAMNTLDDIEADTEEEGQTLEQYLDDDEKGDISNSFPSMQSSDRQVITYQDAAYEVGRILAPQIGSDRIMLEKGMVDIRRLTNIGRIEQLWLSYFLQLPDDQGGEWMRNFATDYMNLAPSIGGMRAKLIIAMQAAINSTRPQRNKAKDDRSFIQRHLTRRNQEPEDVLDVGV